MEGSECELRSGFPDGLRCHDSNRFPYLHIPACSQIPSIAFCANPAFGFASEYRTYADSFNPFCHYQFGFLFIDKCARFHQDFT